MQFNSSLTALLSLLPLVLSARNFRGSRTDEPNPAKKPLIDNEELLRMLRKVAKGDEDAFRDFYEEMHGMVFRYVARLTKDNHHAEDIMIDTFAAVWKSASSYRGTARVSTWVIGIARNLTMNKLRRDGGVEEDLSEEMPQPAVQFADCSALQTSRLLRDALDRLTQSHREILDMVFLNEMRYEDIAEVVGIPVNTVKTRVYYAKQRLAAVLQEMGVTKDDVI